MNIDPNHIKFVLVETSHPGNIGAAARAMKNMSLSRLALVTPKQFPHADATARASGADDLLERAEIHDSIESAVADCAFVVGTSARPRHLYIPEYTPRECAEKLALESQEQPVAILFGREDSGLSNTELDFCNAQMRIPTNPDYSSLNLGAAVQVMAYEMMLQCEADQPAAEIVRENPLATQDEMEGFYAHLEQVITKTGFFDPDNPGQMMRRLRRLYQRAQVDRNEMNILRGILTSVQQSGKR